MNQVAFQFPAAAHKRVRLRRATECTEAQDAREPSWSERAYAFLVEYSATHSAFLAEELIHASRGKVSEPPTTKAWGGVVLRASRSGFLRKVGYSDHTRNAQPKILWSRA